MTTLELYYNELLISIAGVNTWMMLVPIVVAIWQRRYLNRALKVFLYYCIASFLIAILEQTFIWATGEYYSFFKPFLTRFKIGNTNFLQILFVLKNYIFLGWFYSIILPEKYSTILKYLAITLSIASIINYLFIEGHNAIGTFNPIAEAVFRFAVPTFYLWFLFRNLLYFPIRKNPYFWISFGLIFINLVALILYFLGDSIYEDNFALYAKIAITRNFLDIISLLFLSIGFWFASYIKYVEPLHHIPTSTK